MDNMIHILLIILVFGFWFVVAKKLVMNKCAQVKTVQAEVIDKYKADTVSRYLKTLKGVSYIVVFSVKDKKLSFHVSEFSYCHYNIKEKGTLKYKGNSIISFQ